MFLWGLAASVPIGLGLATFATPRVVEYIEMITIKGSIRNVYDAIRFQKLLMKWSAWPSETGSACAVEGDDGKVGAKTVFTDKKGKPFGYQKISGLEECKKVSFILESKGPPHKPELHFHLSRINDETTRVILHFRNDITPPFNLIQHVAGIVKWTREMHLKDLDGLKRYIESGDAYTGELATTA